jgi:hypothetical protein
MSNRSYDAPLRGMYYDGTYQFRLAICPTPTPSSLTDSRPGSSLRLVRLEANGAVEPR